MNADSVQFIDVDKIDPFEPNRKPNPKLVEQIAQSLIEHKDLFYEGLLQPIGVKPNGDRYRGIFGNTRLAATKLAGRKTIACHVLPKDATPGDELKFSLKENHLRENESVESTLSRVQAYAAYANCSFAAAARKCGVSKSYVSKAKKISASLSIDAKAFAQSNSIGISILYLLTTAPEAKQLKLLEAYVAKELDRDAFARACRSTDMPKTKMARLDHVIDGVSGQFSFPEDANWELLESYFATLKRQFRKHRKNGIPCKLLHEVMVNGDQSPSKRSAQTEKELAGAGNVVS